MPQKNSSVACSLPLNRFLQPVAVLPSALPSAPAIHDACKRLAVLPLAGPSSVLHYPVMLPGEGRPAPILALGRRRSPAEPHCIQALAASLAPHSAPESTSSSVVLPAGVRVRPLWAPSPPLCRSLLAALHGNHDRAKTVGRRAPGLAQPGFTSPPRSPHPVAGHQDPVCADLPAKAVVALRIRARHASLSPRRTGSILFPGARLAPPSLGVPQTPERCHSRFVRPQLPASVCLPSVAGQQPMAFTGSGNRPLSICRCSGPVHYRISTGY